MIVLKALLGALLAVAAVLFTSSSYAAVSCTINGSITLDSSDSYYCDTGVLGASACYSWREKDLDSTTVPLAYMEVGVLLNDNTLANTVSDANGNWSLTFSLQASQCRDQQVVVRYYFNRVNENDLAKPQFYRRSRFWLVDVDWLMNDKGERYPVTGNALWSKGITESLAGSTTNVQRHWSRDASDPQTSTRLANVFYTASSYLKEATTWSPNLDARFAGSPGPVPTDAPSLKIGIDESIAGYGFVTGVRDILIDYDGYGVGFAIRHELGHATHHQVHHEDISGECATYNFCSSCPPVAPSSVGFAAVRGCEYGSTATSEALASFFAVRSITNNQTRAWDCTCFDSDKDGAGLDTAIWDICSRQALLTSDPDGDSDWIWNCPMGSNYEGFDFAWIGDFRSSSPSTCVRLRADGDCDCSYSSSSKWCLSPYSSTTGWRNSTQINRFFWDMIDDSTDGGLDDTNLSIQDFVAAMEAMPCVGYLGGVDGSCEEQAPSPATGQCNPLVDGATSPSGTGTRDSYNAWDFAEMFAGDQSTERTLNCVQGAQD